MNELLSLVMDAVLAGLLIVGIMYAVRLNRQLQNLRAGQSEMGRFVADFSATVMRAEAGIRGLKQAAREGGDELEHLITKASTLRDELQFLIDSADSIATRLSDTAASTARSRSNESHTTTSSKDATKAAMAALAEARAIANAGTPRATRQMSGSERDLKSALEKAG